MTLDLVGHLDAMLAGPLGVDVVVGGDEGRGFFDEDSVGVMTEGGMTAQVRATTLRVRTGAFPKLKRSAVVVVADRGEYTAESSHLENDGKETVIHLARTST